MTPDRRTLKNEIDQLTDALGNVLSAQNELLGLAKFRQPDLVVALKRIEDRVYNLRGILARRLAAASGD